VHGLFDWLASWAMAHARGSSTRLFALLYAVGVLVTVFLSNDATAVVLTPAVLAVVKKAGAKDPLPHLFACAMIANAASFVLPISNPANLLLYRHDMPTLGRWLATYALPSLLSIGATFVVLRAWFASALRERLERSAATPMPRSAKLVAVGLVLVTATLVLASLLGWELGLPTFVASLVIALLVSLAMGTRPQKLLSAVSWTTLLLVAALFVLVAGGKQLGALRYTEHALAWARAQPPHVGIPVVGGTIAFANNLFNNLPVGLLTGATLKATHESGALASAAVIGVDLGPNLAVTGSLATILWLIALRREGQRVRFLDFMKIGAVVMPVALIAALAGLWLETLLQGAS
ncbi:MAG: SLC13 family permease, partial [Polyangia bacterium]